MKATIRVAPREGLFHSVYARRHGYSEFYVGASFTKWGGRKKAERHLFATELENSAKYEVSL